MNVLIFVSITITFAYGERLSYKNDKIYNIICKNSEEQKKLLNITLNAGVDVLSYSKNVNTPISIFVKADQNDNLQTTLKNDGFAFEMVVDDVESVLPKVIIPELTGTVTFDRIMRYDEIIKYMDHLEKDHSDIVKIRNLGQTFEGRDQKLVEISTDRNASKRKIIIDGGMHGLEWCTTALALYIIDELVNNEVEKKLLKRYDWHILPVFNPDGYEYSHETDPFWRKTRSTSESTTCIGADVNRNFDFHWNDETSVSDPCSHHYRGVRPFSEKETTNFKNYIKDIKEKEQVYINLHSYGSYIFVPWGFSNIHPIDISVHKITAKMARIAILKIGGPRYSVGPFAKFYEATGLSTDWIHAKGVGLVYAIKLPASGRTGFHPISSEIKTISKQAFAGIKLIAKLAKKVFI